MHYKKKGTTNKLTEPITNYTENNNKYALLSHTFDDTPDPPQPRPPRNKTPKAKKKKTTQSQKHVQHTLRLLAQQEDAFLERSITRAEQEKTELAKRDMNNKMKQAIDAAHKLTSHKMGWLQQGKHSISAIAKRFVNKINGNTKHVRFASKHSVREFTQQSKPTMMTYDSGADGHYISEKDRKAANLPILKKSNKRVSVANGTICKAQNVTKLPFQQLSAHAQRADTFQEFPTSLLSVGKISDDNTISIFTKDGVTVHKEQDVLVTYKGEPVFIGVRDENGRYRIPLTQQHGSWQPRKPSKKARQVLRQANSVYDLPSIEQAIKWMHAVCGYPVKSTWLKAVKAGNYIGWPLLTEQNVKKYYPETTETSKGHLNQTRKNVRSTKTQHPLEIAQNIASMKGKKQQDIFVKTYEVRETIFSDQTGQFPTRSQRGNKYIMVLVEIDSNAILVEPMKNRTDTEMIRAYDTLIKRLQRAGIQPKKHVLDNEISTNMKEHIKDKYKFEIELVPPGCHRRNAAEVAIRNFKSHFLSVLAGAADTFPPSLWDRLLPQTEVTLNLLRQSNATPTVSAYAHLCGPFDYNKMPLAPMGCEVQIHEKTDKRGTWAYHSLDGWYLNTSPEHYRTHNCHVKTTKSERLSDTVQFQHKNITNPTISHTDKIMHAIANCKEAIGKALTHQPTQQLRELNQIINNITTTKPQAQPVPRVQEKRTQPVPRVKQQNNQSVPRVPTSNYPSNSKKTIQPSTPRRKTKRRAKPPPTPVFLPKQPPALSTRAQVAKQKAQPTIIQTPTRPTTKLKQPPKSKLKQPTPRRSSRIAKTGQALAALIHDKFHRPNCVVAINQLEKEVEKAMAVMDKETGKMLNYRQLMTNPKHSKQWHLSSANEFGRLANGVGGRVKGTNTIKFIKETQVPRDRKKDVTYGSFQCTVRPEKAEPNRTRFTVGGDKINYPGEVATPTADMLVAKILFNSVISTPGAKFMTMDISNFYLMTPLKRPEYIKVKISDLPQEIIDEYQLKEKVNAKGFVFIEVTKGMYGLPQAGLLANELLEQRLNKHGYFQSKLVPGLWTHKTRPIQFTLVVDDFGVKYVGKEHAIHLQKVLEQHYKVTTDWTGSRYVGIHLLWDYQKRQVHLHMPEYVKKALKQFGHVRRKVQNQPFPHTPIKYGAKQQFPQEQDNSPPVDAKTKQFIQQVCGKFLFLGRAIDGTLLTPISAIASQSASPTENTLEQTKQFLDYLATQEEAVLTYHASEMILAVHSDAGYLNEPKARSRAGGHFFLSRNSNDPPNNGAILNISHIIKHVMSSATEAELAALYIMAKEAVYIRIILQELGHKQPATPIQTDNAMADAVVNGKIQPKRTKAMDMRFHWLRDRETQQQFNIYWRPGHTNKADYWTKHHSAAHHVNIRKQFLTPYIALEMLRLNQSAAAAA